MSAFARVLLIVLTMAGMPAAKAACIVGDSPKDSPADPPAHAGRCNAPEPLDGRVTTEQLDAIMKWITQRFELLPPSADLPAIVFESPAGLSRMRHGGFVPHPSNQSAPNAPHRSGRGDILAVYNDARRTIYLSDEWTGKTDADLSVLVHEMVHHLQNVAGLRYSCAGEREHIAYRAQSAWLLQSGKSLQSEFQLDGFSLMMHSSCL